MLMLIRLLFFSTQNSIRFLWEFYWKICCFCCCCCNEMHAKTFKKNIIHFQITILYLLYLFASASDANRNPWWAKLNSVLFGLSSTQTKTDVSDSRTLFNIFFYFFHFFPRLRQFPFLISQKLNRSILPMFHFPRGINFKN